MPRIECWLKPAIAGHRANKSHMSSHLYYHIAENAADYVTRATDHIAAALSAAISKRGCASLLVSGGSSPKPIYEALSRMELAWEKVTVSLVDERWVHQGEVGSNADFIQQTLLQNKANTASFVGLVNNASNAKTGAAAINSRFQEAFGGSVDICIMGMGTDGHTASWFPQSKTLDAAFDLENAPQILWQDAKGQKGASGFDDRITVSLSCVMASRKIYLLIPGAAKKAVWEASEAKDVYEAPVTSLRAAGDRLHVFTHGES